jgi:poly-gamma-glutamate synthesis protein (capsule biosynthesis protein)
MNAKILFLGDVYLTDACLVTLPSGYPIIFNLEAPISNRGTPIQGKINLSMREGLLEKVFNPLPIAASLANNHIMDYGNDAFEDTLINLDKLGVKYFGAGRSDENYNNPLIISIGKLKVGLLGYCYAFYYNQINNVEGLVYGPAPLEMDRIQADIANLKKLVDRIVLTFHWGIEESNIPEAEQIFFAREISKMGADCIIGHHSHAVQPVEKYRNAVIAYGLGNFIFPDLNTPSFYNDSGIPTRNFQKRQRLWNRNSIGLHIDITTLTYNILPFFFDGKQVTNRKTVFHRYASLNIEKVLQKLPRSTTLHFKWKRLLTAFIAFIEKPKIPKLQTLVYLIKLLFRKNYDSNQGLR